MAGPAFCIVGTSGTTADRSQQIFDVGDVHLEYARADPNGLEATAGDVTPDGAVGHVAAVCGGLQADQFGVARLTTITGWARIGHDETSSFKLFRLSRPSPLRVSRTAWTLPVMLRQMRPICPLGFAGVANERREVFTVDGDLAVLFAVVRVQQVDRGHVTRP